jgi:fermentation-respiration switch protein FrsA (DUF1100 family)
MVGAFPPSQSLDAYLHGDRERVIDLDAKIAHGAFHLVATRAKASMAGACYGLLIPAYRGYLGSTGRATEKALVADGLLASDYLKAQGVAPDRIVLYGESLGTGIATQVASERQASAVILEAPYSSVAAEGEGPFRDFSHRLAASRSLRIRSPHRPVLWLPEHFAREQILRHPRLRGFLSVASGTASGVFRRDASVFVSSRVCMMHAL